MSKPDYVSGPKIEGQGVIKSVETGEQESCHYELVTSTSRITVAGGAQIEGLSTIVGRVDASRNFIHANITKRMLLDLRDGRKAYCAFHDYSGELAFQGGFLDIESDE